MTSPDETVNPLDREQEAVIAALAIASQNSGQRHLPDGVLAAGTNNGQAPVPHSRMTETRRALFRGVCERHLQGLDAQIMMVLIEDLVRAAEST